MEEVPRRAVPVVPRRRVYLRQLLVFLEDRRAQVDLAGRDRRRRFARDLVEVLARRGHAAQVEQREAERRVHERGLHVDTEQHSEPDQVDAQLVRNGRQQWHDDERQLEEIEEEREQEGKDVHDDEKADLAAGQAGEQVLDPQDAVHAAEREAEYGRADQDEHHERSQLGGRVHGLLEQRPAQAPVDERQRQRAGGAHRAALGRRRDAEEDGSQYQEDERERRDQHEEHAGNKLPAAQQACFGRQRRRQFGKQQRGGKNIDRVQRGEDEARKDRAGVHVADRASRRRR